MSSFDRIVPVVVDHQLRFELVDHAGSGEVEVINFNEVFNLLNLTVKQPVEVMKVLLKLKLGLNRIYLYYREQHERAKLELYDYEYQMQDKYSRKDTSNPLHGEKKLTMASIEAAIKKEEDWKRLNDAVKEIENYKMHLGACKDIVEETLTTAQHFISNPVEVDATVTDTDDLARISSLASFLTEG